MEFRLLIPRLKLRGAATPFRMTDHHWADSDDRWIQISVALAPCSRPPPPTAAQLRRDVCFGQRNGGFGLGGHFQNREHEGLIVGNGHYSIRSSASIFAAVKSRSLR